MNSTRQLIDKAVSMRNQMRPGPMEIRAARDAARAAMPIVPAPAPAHQQPQSPAPAPQIYPEQPAPMRQSVYSDLMKKHDKLNPRIK